MYKNERVNICEKCNRSKERTEAKVKKDKVVNVGAAMVKFLVLISLYLRLQKLPCSTRCTNG